MVSRAGLGLGSRGGGTVCCERSRSLQYRFCNEAFFLSSSELFCSNMYIFESLAMHFQAKTPLARILCDKHMYIDRKALSAFGISKEKKVMLYRTINSTESRL